MFTNSNKKNIIDGSNMNRVSWGRTCIDLHLLGIRKKTTIICEGNDDDKFLRKIAPQFGVDINGFEIVTCHGRTSHINTVVDALREKNPDQQFIILLDQDFSLKFEVTSKYLEFLKMKKTKVLYWDLPCIESYLFVYIAAKKLLEDEFTTFNPLFFLQSEEFAEKFSCKYTNGFIANNSHQRKDKSEPALSGTAEMFNRWKNAIEISMKPKPTVAELCAVARVIHGHTWVKKICQTTTASLIQTIQDDFNDYFPSLTTLMKDFQITAIKQ